jgi:hypothetical protein
MEQELNGHAAGTGKSPAKGDGPTVITIPAPNLRVVHIGIRGIAPYVQNKFSDKARQIIVEGHKQGSTRRKGKKREPKDFEAGFRGAIHRSEEGWCGIPANAFRNAMVSACRLVGFKMTLAKLSIFVLEDGFDPEDQTPLVRITGGEPTYVEHCVRNQTGVVDVRPRAMWATGWEALTRVQYDADQFTERDVANLMLRVGLQVGVGEGRPDSRQSCGMNWGRFELL